MKITLYRPYEDAWEENLRPLKLKIVGKMITYEQLPLKNSEGIYDPDDYEFCSRFFDYKSSNDYQKAFPKLRLNTEIKISYWSGADDLGDSSPIGGISGFAHLGIFQKIILNLWFGRSFFQKSENLKWLIGLIAGTGVVTFGIREILGL